MLNHGSIKLPLQELSDTQTTIYLPRDNFPVVLRGIGETKDGGQPAPSAGPKGSGE